MPRTPPCDGRTSGAGVDSSDDSPPPSVPPGSIPADDRDASSSGTKRGKEHRSRSAKKGAEKRGRLPHPKSATTPGRSDGGGGLADLHPASDPVRDHSPSGDLVAALGRRLFDTSGVPGSLPLPGPSSRGEPSPPPLLRGERTTVADRRPPAASATVTSDFPAGGEVVPASVALRLDPPPSGGGPSVEGGGPDVDVRAVKPGPLSSAAPSERAQVLTGAHNSEASVRRHNDGFDTQGGPYLPPLWPYVSLHGGPGAGNPWGSGYPVAGAHGPPLVDRMYGTFPPTVPYWGMPYPPRRSNTPQTPHVNQGDRDHRTPGGPSATTTSSHPSVAPGPAQGHQAATHRPFVPQDNPWAWPPAWGQWQDRPTGPTPSPAGDGLLGDGSRPTPSQGPGRARSRGNRGSAHATGSPASSEPPLESPPSQEGSGYSSGSESGDESGDSSPPSPGGESHGAPSRDQAESTSDLAWLEKTLPDRVTRSESAPPSVLEPLALLQQEPPSSRTSLRLKVPALAQELLDKPARVARSADSIPPPGKESFAAPGAFPPGKFLKDSLKGGVWSLYTSDHPAYRTAEPSAQDRMLVPPHSSFPTTVTLPFKVVAEWDKMARRCLLEASTAYTFLNALLHRTKELWEEGSDWEAGPSSAGAQGPFVDPRFQSFGKKVAAGLTAAAETASCLHFNTLLARRDAVLKLSNLPPDELAALRTIPAQPHALFGPYAPPFVSHRAETNREVASYSAQAPRNRRDSRPEKRPPSQGPAQASQPKKKTKREWRQDQGKAGKRKGYHKRGKHPGAAKGGQQPKPHPQ